MILDKLKAYGFQALAFVLFVLLVSQTWRLHTAQAEAATAVATLANARATSAIQVAKDTGAVRSTESGLQAAATETRNQTNDQVRTLSAQRDSLLARVRVAEANAATAALVSRTAAAAGPGQAASGSADSELLRPLGEEDVHEAERGDVIRLHLAACYAQYDRAQAALKALGGAQ